MKIFVPMDNKGQPLKEGATKVAGEGAERRKFTRHRFSARVEIRRDKGLDVDAMMFELSEGGMSAATANMMTIGEKVEVNAIAGQRVQAIVRRKHGAMYGFEFLGLSEDTRERIRNVVRGLPVFLSILEDV